MFLQEQMELPEVPSEPLPEKIPGMLYVLCSFGFSYFSVLCNSLRPSPGVSIVSATVREHKHWLEALFIWAVPPHGSDKPS